METCANKPAKKPSKLEEMTKEQIREAILKKRECTSKAQNIVESLLEKDIIEDYFLRCLPDINQSHFEDIIEERSIIRLCGYPICSKTLSDRDIPKQKYRISVKTNKVYDITTRKSFCSNSCYNSAMYLKKQLLTSPLWFREYEIIPSYNLLPLEATGSMGQEIDVSIVEKIKIKTDASAFTSLYDFTSASLNDINNESDPIDSKNDKNNLEEHTNKTAVTENSKETELESKQADNIQNNNIIQNNDDKRPVHQQNNQSSKENNDIEKTKSVEAPTKHNPKSNPFNIVGDIIEKPERKIDPIISNVPEQSAAKDTKKGRAVKKIVQKKQPLVTVLTVEVEKSLAEWFTLDTMLYLFGEEKVKEMVKDKGESIKQYLNNYAQSIFYNSNAYDQYQQLCKKLNMLELEDRRNDSQTLQREMKPLPDYSILQEESKRMQLKVKAFLSGATEVSATVVTEEDKANPDEENFTQLPLVDKNAQNALRRRIVCQHLHKVLPDLLRSLGLLSLTISSDVRFLVNTFKLKATNIMFKPIQWTLIAIVFIKLLSLRDRRLEYLMGQQMAYQHMQLLLLSYKQDGGYLDRLISWLTDIDRLLDTNDTQLTLE